MLQGLYVVLVLKGCSGGNLFYYLPIRKDVTISLRGKLVLYPNAYLKYCCNKVTNSYPIGKLIDNYSLVMLYCDITCEVINLCFIR